MVTIQDWTGSIASRSRPAPPLETAGLATGLDKAPTGLPLWHRFRDWMHHRWELRQTRQTLLGLTDEQLRDVGLTRHEAETEGQRSFHVYWSPPKAGPRASSGPFL